VVLAMGIEEGEVFERRGREDFAESAEEDKNKFKIEDKLFSL
jgi:hypothetical protein